MGLTCIWFGFLCLEAACAGVFGFCGLIVFLWINGFGVDFSCCYCWFWLDLC